MSVRIEVNIADEVTELERDLPDGALLTPVAVWFSGMGTQYVTIEFDVEETS